MPFSCEDFDRLCRDRIAPRAAAVDAAGAIEPATMRALADAGYLAMFHDGTDGEAQGRAMEALARACAATFWAASISTVLCGKMLSTLCSEASRERWLGPIAAGDVVGSFGASEDGAGSDPGSYRTVLYRAPDGTLRLDGAKSRITNACTADVCVVVAREGDPRSGPLCYAVVDLSAPGVSRRELPRVGLRGVSWGVIELHSVVVEEAHVVRDVSYEATLGAVEWGQLLQAWCGIGIGEAALDAAARHVRERAAFGRPLAHLEAVHGPLGRMRAELDAVRLLAREVSRQKGEGRLAREAVMMAKIAATEVGVSVAQAAMRVSGGWGFATTLPFERLVRDSLGNVPAGLPNDRLRELLACAMLDASPWAYEPLDWLEPAGLAIGG